MVKETSAPSVVYKFLGQILHCENRPTGLAFTIYAHSSCIIKRLLFLTTDYSDDTDFLGECDGRRLVGSCRAFMKQRRKVRKTIGFSYNTPGLCQKPPAAFSPYPKHTTPSPSSLRQAQDRPCHPSNPWLKKLPCQSVKFVSTKD